MGGFKLYKEIVKCKNNRAIILLIIFTLLFVLTSVVDLLRHAMPPIAEDIATVVIFSAAVYFIIRFLIYEYKYSLIEDEIIFTRITGDKEHTLMRANIKFLKCIAKKGDSHISSFNKINTSVNCCGMPFRSQTYHAIFCVEDKTIRVAFQPSEKLLDILKTRLGDDKVII